MKEEEVDQYFKNKFDGFAPAPAADAWERLQNQLAPPPPKRRTMGIYYAAASLSLLVLSGALFFWLRTPAVTSPGNLARQAPVVRPLAPKTVGPVVAGKSREEAFALPATLAVRNENHPVAKTAKAVTGPGKGLKKTRKIRPERLIAAAPANGPAGGPPQAVPVEPTVTPAPVTSLPAPTLANHPAPTPPITILEVVIKKDAATPVASTDDAALTTASDALRRNLAKKGKLVKNIFKQARNLKNGEKVELSTLGLSANYRIDVESKILKQKYTKVINL